MPIEKRSFFEGMDGDTSQRLLSDKVALNIMNARMAISEYGRMGRLENTPGMLYVPQSVIPPYGGDQTIGTATDLNNGRLLWFNYNDLSNNGIYCYDPNVGTTGTVYAVVYDSQVVGGLGFSRDSLIHSARVENGYLYWADSTNNEPRRININSGIEANHPGTFTDTYAYTFPMRQNVLYWIRRQPGLPPSAVKIDDSGVVNNLIKDEGFWFAYRYIYRGYEISTLSAWSELLNYNSIDETYNSITIEIPLLEYIDQDVLQVDVVVKYANGGKAFVIKSWNKNIAIDAADIANHNAGSNNLDFNYANDFIGIALDDAYSVKPYDSVPIYAQTIEMARNRSLMGNFVIGYDTPTETSLLVEANIQTDSATPTGRWVSITYNFGANVHYFLDVQGLASDNGYYDYTPQPPAFPATVAFGSMTFVASGPSNFALYVVANYPDWTGGIVDTGNVSDITGSPPVAGLSGSEALKSGGSYWASISFLDHAGRKCGILTKPELKVDIAEREYAQVDYTTGINWTLNNLSAVNEIPEWAAAYSIDITKCLTTRYFLQSKVRNITYVTKVVADGTYVFNTNTYAATLNGVGIDITLLNSYGMGYVFSEGDFVKVYISTSIYTLSVVAQDGNWIVCELQDLGALGNTGTPKTDVLFEVFTPYRPSSSEAHYEVGQIYPIDNPGTLSREYSTLAGTIGGDITLLTRNDGSADYLTENMSPNDKFYQVWNTDSGRPNFVDDIGQQTKTNYIAYSDVYIQGSKVNGLSTYEALNQSDTPSECGDLTKLQTANKVGDEQGGILLAIHQHEVVSIYLGEVQLVGASANAFVAQSAGFIGTKNILKGSFGTTRPESVFEYLGLVFGIDLKQGVFWQYSAGGLEPVSRYNQSRFFKRYCMDYLAASSGNLDNINGFHHIRANINPFTKEVLVTLPALIYENYADVLPSYGGIVPDYATSIINRFDIFDQLQKTMSFQYEENKWGNNYEWIAEWSEYLQNQAYAFKDGFLYILDRDTENWNNAFGVNYPVRICITGNLNPSALKVLNNISLESNAIPDYTVAYTDYPNIQITDLAGTDPEWVNEEGLMYADFLKDRLSPNSIGTPDEKLFIGDDLTDIVLKIMVEFQAYDNLFYCNFIDIGYSISRGQKQILNPINT